MNLHETTARARFRWHFAGLGVCPSLNVNPGTKVVIQFQQCGNKSIWRSYKNMCTAWQQQRLKTWKKHVHSVATRASEEITRTCAQRGNKSVWRRDKNMCTAWQQERLKKLQEHVHSVGKERCFQHARARTLLPPPTQPPEPPPTPPPTTC